MNKNERLQDLDIDIENLHPWQSSIFNINSTAFPSELRKLRHRTRNQVRGILAADVRESISLINQLRKNSSANELLQIDRVLRTQTYKAESFIPDLFPILPQTSESYHRLSLLTFTKQLEIVENLVAGNQYELTEFLNFSFDIGSCILQNDLAGADNALGGALSKIGHSHFLLRKAALIRSLNFAETPLPSVDKLLDDAGVGSNNLIGRSLLQCYEAEQDFLSMKRSILNLPARGKSNKYTRDITRLPFHPHAKDENDLCEMIQSNLQSSLIDALLLIKINRHFVDESRYFSLFTFLDTFESTAIDIELVAEGYLGIDDGESLFYKHSSAWYESSAIVEYRLLQDHFFDDPEAVYFKIDAPLLDRISSWVGNINLKDIVGSNYLTSHPYQNLKKLENNGVITKSSVFNFLVHKCEGYAEIAEADLFELMGNTKDLAKTINVKFVRTLAKNTSSQESKIIFYLLIARKSKNEADNHALRRLIQLLVKEKHNGMLVDFISSLGDKSREVAEYTYEVCTEDFIAKLSHIISSSAQITETRIDLHKWMGETTGDKGYLDRARTLLIDHQINRIRNEIDDNRIYVDVSRFSEWVNDELMRELNAVLTGMGHNDTLDFASDDQQLLHIIERAYAAFCGNNIFGIASYLGRRIRHGTFKGHLYSSVISIIDMQYLQLINDPALFSKWSSWKLNYESSIDNIIRERLHVEVLSKRDGLLKPNLKSQAKVDIAKACAQNLAKDFKETNSLGAVQLLTEYCWRLAEVDLKNIQSFIKGQKSNLIRSDLINDFKVNLNNNLQESVKEFNRDLLRLVNDKLNTMYEWFKRPLSVSPKASLSLLYKAVVAEVKDTFPHLEADTNFDEDKDIELIGGPYHVLYDAFYVVVYNAAKHGKFKEKVERQFSIKSNDPGYSIVVTITSAIPDHLDDVLVNKSLKLSPDDDIDNAQLSETRSGIRKLYHLQQTDTNFSIEDVICENRRVTVKMSYALEH